jgi:hypothetical protein
MRMPNTKAASHSPAVVLAGVNPADKILAKKPAGFDAFRGRLPPSRRAYASVAKRQRAGLQNLHRWFESSPELQLQTKAGAAWIHAAPALRFQDCAPAPKNLVSHFLRE